MKPIRVVGFVLCCAMGLGKVCSDNFTQHLELHQYLKKSIHKSIRPLLNQSQPIYIHLYLSIVTIHELDAKTQVLSSTLGMRMVWTSETLTWNSTIYGDAKVVRIPWSDTWLPDVMLKDIDNNWALNPGYLNQVSIESDGSTTWYIGGNFRTNCRVDITKYPFDIQTCKFTIGTQYSSDDNLVIIPFTDRVDEAVYSPNDEWDLTDTGITMSVSARGRSEIIVRFTLSRRPLFYIFTIIVPVSMLSFMNILSFKLPVASGERVGYCVALFLTFTVLLDTISGSMPKVSGTFSYLQLFVNIQLIMGVIITSVSIFLVNMHVYGGENIPGFLHTLCTKLKSSSKQEDDDNHETNNEREETDSINDNVIEHVENVKGKPKLLDPNEVVKVLDSYLFYGFSLLFVCANVICIISMITYSPAL